MDLPMGDGGYDFVARLSAGGMAELFLACRRGAAGIAHPVVVKRLRPEARRDPSIVRMFLWEAWISARLQHPNVIRFHDFVFHEGRHHLIFEYVPGCDLAVIARAFFAEGRPFPIEEAIEIGIGLLRALGHAHDLRDDGGRRVGLVHRDVSPQNVLLSRDGEVKLIDFGVAKMTVASILDDTGCFSPLSIPGGELMSTGSGLVKGKLAYVAPEQLRGQRIDARADLFAVGVMLFELLTGRRLFHRKDDGDTMRAVLSGEVPAIALLRPACPALLEEVVRRALARDPDGRYEGAAQMEEALAEVLASLRAAPTSERSGPRSGERGLLSGQALAAIVREVVGSRDRHRLLLSRLSRRRAAGAGRGSARVRRGAAARPGDAREQTTLRARPSRAMRISARQGLEMDARPRSRWSAHLRGRRPRPSRGLRLLPWVLFAAVTFAAGALTAKAIGALRTEAAAATRPATE